MSRAPILQWVGFGVSLICSMLCGLALGYNVYAVQLKELFDITQTQVELLGSFTVIGWSLVFLGSLVYQRFGYRACNVMSAVLMTSSSLLMCLSTYYVTFFREWSGLMCVFLLIFTAGAGAGILSCSAVGVELFSEKHSGKIIGLYAAVLGFGKIYYSALYQIFFQTHELLGNFFAVVAVSIAVSFALCCFLHKPTGSRDISDTENLSETTKILDQSNDENSFFCWSALLTSGYFWMMVSVTVVFHATLLAFMNNVTGIAESVSLSQSLSVVYILAVVLVTCRLIFGAIYDHFQSQTAGAILLLFCQISFCSAMLLGLLALTDVTIYILIALSAVACGAGVTIPLTMMTSYFGKESYPGIVAVVDLGIGLVNIAIHVVSGVTYDREALRMSTSDLFCKECFTWTFVILLSTSLGSAVLLIINTLICVKR